MLGPEGRSVRRMGVASANSRKVSEARRVPFGDLRLSREVPVGDLRLLETLSCREVSIGGLQAWFDWIGLLTCSG